MTVQHLGLPGLPQGVYFQVVHLAIQPGEVLPDTGATVYSFAANVTEFSPDGPVEGILETDVTLEITGAVTES